MTSGLPEGDEIFIHLTLTFCSVRPLPGAGSRGWVSLLHAPKLWCVGAAAPRDACPRISLLFWGFSERKRVKSHLCRIQLLNMQFPVESILKILFWWWWQGAVAHLCPGPGQLCWARDRRQRGLGSGQRVERGGRGRDRQGGTGLATSAALRARVCSPCCHPTVVLLRGFSPELEDRLSPALGPLLPPATQASLTQRFFYILLCGRIWNVTLLSCFIHLN